MPQKTGFGENRSKMKASAQKKNKKHKGTELEMVMKDGKATILEEIDTMFGEDGDELTDGKVKKVFERQFKQLREDLDASNAGNMNASHTSRMMTHAMLAMVVDLIPVAEKAYRNSQKEQAAYALNAMVNQARELSTDLKMMQDVEGQAEFIRNKLLGPVFMSLTQQILASIMALKNNVDTELGSKAPKTARRLKKELDENLRALGDFLSQSNSKLGSDIERYLSGDPTLLGTKKSKRH